MRNPLSAEARNNVGALPLIVAILLLMSFSPFPAKRRLTP